MRTPSVIPFLLAAALVVCNPGFLRADEKVTGKTFYTRVNIWHEQLGGNMWHDRFAIESTNYHRGQIIPIGTKVKIVEIYDGKVPRDRSPLDPPKQDYPCIRFDVAGGQPYQIMFKPKHAKPGMTIWELFKQYFAEKDPMREGGEFRSLSAQEQESVMAGKVMPGMSKEAVIMAYGYPPGNRTPSLAADTWIYAEYRLSTRRVDFIDGKVAMPGSDLEAIRECIKTCKENTSRTPEQCFDACNK